MTEIREQTFEIPGSDGLPIHGDLRAPMASSGTGPGAGEGAPPLLVGCHGFKGFKDWGFWPHIGRALAARGHPNVVFNFSHNGVGAVGADLENFTRLDLFRKNHWGREMQDLGAVLDAVGAGRLPLADAYDGARIQLLGHSRGGGVVLLQGGRDVRVERVVSVAAISHVDRFSDEVKDRWRKNGHISLLNMRTKQEMFMDVSFLDELEREPDTHSIERAVRAYRVPLLVVHGDADESVRVEEAHEILGWAPDGLAQSMIVPGGDHVLGSKHPFPGSNPMLDQFIERVDAFLGAR